MEKFALLQNEFYYNLGNTGRIIKAAHVANLFKGGTLPYLLLLIYVTGNINFTTCCYTILHGTYGILWVIKSMTFPDKNFE